MSNISKLSDIYSDKAPQYERYQKLRQKLESLEATFKTFCRSPGRVNLISEHTDYNGYQVSPIALENDFVMAVGYVENDDHLVKIYHLDDNSHHPDSFDYTKPKEEISRPTGEWSMYVRAGFHAAITHDPELVQEFNNKTIVVVGCGTVPLGSGLSSSSALTCCSVLAFLSYSTMELDKTKIAAIVAKSEATVAIEGGGMDQAISLCAQRGKCSVIHFNPLHLEFVDLPDNIYIAVFSSLKDSKKATAANNFYNTRVAECRSGCALLYQKYMKRSNKDFVFSKDVKINMCYDIQKLYGKSSPSGMLLIVDELPEQLTLGQLTKELGFEDYQQLVDQLYATAAGKPLLRDYDINTEIVIRKRLRHVYSEAYRAMQFEKAMRQLRKDNEDSQKFALTTASEFINDS